MLVRLEHMTEHIKSNLLIYFLNKNSLIVSAKINHSTLTALKKKSRPTMKEKFGKCSKKASINFYINLSKLFM